LTVSRRRAGLVITFAAVSLMAGAQAAQACTEPALGDLPARGQEKKLVRFELTGLTPGSEYLVKVNGRERKSGVAATDKVSRRFRMPNMGDSNRRVLVEVVIAHDSCETSPWKLQEKMTYRPAPEPQAPQAQPAPAPTPAPAPSPVPDLSPSPPPAPDPPAAPSITDSKPAPQPAVPTPAPNPAAPAVPVPGATEPPRDGKAWITPLDPYQRAENAPPKLRQGALARAEQPSEVANSTAALVGLAGIFLLFSGVGAIGWNRFRRYDNERLEEVENPEGKLPTHLDPKAKDMTEEVAKKKRRLLPWRKPSVPSTAVPVAGAAVAAAAAGDGAGKTTAEPRTGGRGVLADLTDEEKAKLSPEEIERLKQERIFERRKAAKKRKKAVLPTFDPTAPGAEAAAAAAAAAAAGAGKPERKDDEPAKK